MTEPSSEPGPAHRYYQQAQGHWRGRMNAKITDAAAVIRAMGLFNALSVLLMGYWPSWLGAINLETTVDYQPDQPVRHTTTVYWLGMAMMTSEELVHIANDGAHFAVRGKSRIHMMPWRTLEMDGHGHVDPSATHATYQLSWMGTEMTQTTERQDDCVLLRQSSPGFEAVQDLRAKTQSPV